MASKHRLVYESLPTKKSMGSRYVIYSDRIELVCRFLLFTKTIVIPKEDLVSIDVFLPPVARTSLFALKIDLADLYEHAGIKRKSGFFKEIRFTPEDPAAFVLKVRDTFS